MNFLIESLLWIVPILMAITIHEVAHGWVAFKLGDPTAKLAGRITLNPIKHIDPFGFILLLIVHFGWAKPVPVNPNYLRNPRRDMVLVSLSGPLSNFLTAVVVALFMKSPLFQFMGDIPGKMIYILFLLSLILLFFNLIPVPPLDGWQILRNSVSHREWMTHFEVYGFFVIVLLLFLPYLLGINPLADYLRATVGFTAKLLLGSIHVPIGV